MKSGDQAKLLGRTLSKTEKGFVLINSPEYAEELARHFDLDMNKSKPIVAPMSPSEVKENDQKLDDYKKSQLRAVVGKLLWLAQDRPDLKYSVARLSTEVSDPKESTWDMAKKVVRYLIGAPLGMITFEPKNTEDIELYIPKNGNQFHFKDGWDPEISDRKSKKKGDKLTLYTDSDWAGDKNTRKSFSGGVLFVRGCLVASWSRRQPTVALSSAEAELAALTVGIAEASYVRNLIEEFDGSISPIVVCDRVSLHGLNI